MLRRLFILLLCTFFSTAVSANVKAVSTTPVTPAAPSPMTLSESWHGSVFRIEDAKSRVSLASVNLSVSDLKPAGGNLVGEYTIQVPLMQSKNDQGRIILPLDFSMEELGVKGGTLRGQAISDKEGKTPNRIVCQIIPGEEQRILLYITTDDRVLKFKSRYSIVQTKINKIDS